MADKEAVKKGIQSLKGTRDFYPEQKAILNYMFDVWKKVAEKFGYSNFDGPLLEPAMLWQLKSGDEIPDQMYAFEDKGGRLVAIRPELTPTLARMVATREKELPKPIKWFSIPRCWRYEQPQSGRLREFFQFNLDLLGTESMKADAEVITTAIKIMEEFGCTKTDFYIRLGNRKLIQSLILSTGVKRPQLQSVCRLIDKRDKLTKKDFELSLKDLELSDKQIKDLVQALDTASLDKIDESKLDEKGKEGLKELKELMQAFKPYGVLEFVEIDLSIMRGFDYYTSTVFEIFDRSKKLRAIAGGGRYDDLVGEFGGTRCPGIGYGMGDVVLEIFLNNLKLLKETQKTVDYYIAPINEKVAEKAVEIATALRDKYKVDIDLVGRNLRKQFDYANSTGAQNVVIVGPKDLESNEVTFRNMESGIEKKVKLKDLKKI